MNRSDFLHLHSRVKILTVVNVKISEITIKQCTSPSSSWISQANDIISSSLPSLVVNYQIGLLLFLSIYRQILPKCLHFTKFFFSSIYNSFYSFIQHFPLDCSLNSSYVGISLWLLLLMLVLYCHYERDHHSGSCANITLR